MKVNFEQNEYYTYHIPGQKMFVTPKHCKREKEPSASLSISTRIQIHILHNLDTTNLTNQNYCSIFNRAINFLSLLLFFTFKDKTKLLSVVHSHFLRVFFLVRLHFTFLFVHKNLKMKIGFMNELVCLLAFACVSCQYLCIHFDMGKCMLLLSRKTKGREKVKNLYLKGCTKLIIFSFFSFSYVLFCFLCFFYGVVIGYGMIYAFV